MSAILLISHLINLTIRLFMFVLRLGKTSGIHSDIANDIRIKRHVANDLNTTENKERDQFVVRLDSLLSDRVMKLCQAKHSCSQGLPGPPGQPGPRGTKGSRGRRGKKGIKGDEGIMGSPGKGGKQGIMGPRGHKGEPGKKGQTGPPGVTGRPGMKGDPGESISSPVVGISPSTLRVNENEAASLQCSASGNPQPIIEWSRNDSTLSPKLEMTSGKITWKKVAGSDSGIYTCTARNILGKAEGFAKLTVNGERKKIFTIDD